MTAQPRELTVKAVFSYIQTAYIATLISGNNCLESKSCKQISGNKSLDAPARVVVPRPLDGRQVLVSFSKARDRTEGTDSAVAQSSLRCINDYTPLAILYWTRCYWFLNSIVIPGSILTSVWLDCSWNGTTFKARPRISGICSRVFIEPFHRRNGTN